MALTKCKECGTEVATSAAACPKCGAPPPKPQVSNAWAIFVTLLIVGLIAGIVVVYKSSDSSTSSGGRSTSADIATLSKFSQISDGMSFAEVVQVMGTSGTVQSSSTLGDSTTTMYSWANDDGANMNVMVQDGHVVSKAQFGLK